MGAGWKSCPPVVPEPCDEPFELFDPFDPEPLTPFEPEPPDELEPDDEPPLVPFAALIGSLVPGFVTAPMAPNVPTATRLATVVPRVSERRRSRARSRSRALSRDAAFTTGLSTTHPFDFVTRPDPPPGIGTCAVEGRKGTPVPLKTP
jgi:hypothetical protein